MFITYALDALQSAIRKIIRDAKVAAKAPRVIFAMLIAETKLALTTRRK